MRKNWKKTLSLVLAAAMVFSMNTFAFAAKKTAAEETKETFSGNSWSSEDAGVITLGEVEDQIKGISKNLIDEAIIGATTVEVTPEKGDAYTVSGADFKENDLTIAYPEKAFENDVLAASEFSYVEFQVSANGLSANSVTGAFYVAPAVKEIKFTKGAGSWSFNIVFDKYVDFSGKPLSNGKVSTITSGGKTWSGSVLSVVAKNNKKVYTGALNDKKAPYLQFKVGKVGAEMDKTVLKDLKKAVKDFNKAAKTDLDCKFYIVPANVQGAAVKSGLPKSKDMRLADAGVVFVDKITNKSGKLSGKAAVGTSYLKKDAPTPALLKLKLAKVGTDAKGDLRWAKNEDGSYTFTGQNNARGTFTVPKSMITEK